MLDQIIGLNHEVIKLIRQKKGLGEVEKKMKELDMIFTKAYQATNDPFFKNGIISMHYNCQKWIKLLQQKKLQYG